MAHSIYDTGCEVMTKQMEYQEEDRESVARRRKDQGLIECEVFGSWPDKLEAGSAWDNCKKTQNSHKDFIPVLEFSEQNLPSQYGHREKLVEYIRALAKLTVKLVVGYVSGSRPNGYAFSNFRYRNVRHVGTGWVFKVTPGDGPCPTEHCPENSASPAEWWRIEVFTACHVVYDKVEAQHTSVEFFYDDENSTATTLNGCSAEHYDQCDDLCMLQCITQDGELARSLMEATSSFTRLKSEVENLWKDPLCVVVSHPHGQPKKVTVGEMIRNGVLNPSINGFMLYTTDTCAGSSGAPVLTSVNVNQPQFSCTWPGAGPHSGANQDGVHNQCNSRFAFVTMVQGVEAFGKQFSNKADWFHNIPKYMGGQDNNCSAAAKQGVAEDTSCGAVANPRREEMVHPQTSENQFWNKVNWFQDITKAMGDVEIETPSCFEDQIDLLVAGLKDMQEIAKDVTDFELEEGEDDACGAAAAAIPKLEEASTLQDFNEIKWDKVEDTLVQLKQWMKEAQSTLAQAQLPKDQDSTQDTPAQPSKPAEDQDKST